MKIGIIDYGSGNLHSVHHSVAHAAAMKTDMQVQTLSDTQNLKDCDYIIVPGVGHFADCWAGLSAIDGMVEALREAVLEKAKPFLGICVGMQLMATASQEYGRHSGFDWIAGDVVPLALVNPPLKIPHMGWNDLILHKPHPVIAGVENGDHVYFVHSYHFVVSDPDQLIATADYGGKQTAIVARDNMIGTQFHPEKSQATGLRMIENFLSWRP